MGKATKHRFGGFWTDKKLRALSDYLVAYRAIFTANRAARFFKTIYFDGFAGTGERVDSAAEGSDAQLSIDAELDAELQKYKRGSVKVALDLASPFDSYVFVEKNKRRARELGALIQREYPTLKERCRIEHGEANAFLRDWCHTTDWRTHRAVVFLDPYGMSVDWDTIARIGRTKAIDLFVLLPLGTGINRLLTRDAPPPKDWAEKLTRILGTPDWLQAFYVSSTQHVMFDGGSDVVKVADFDSAGRFFLDRLCTVFAGVSPFAMPLLNTRNNPMYLLCFAAGNARGARAAVNIANHLLKA